MEEGDIVNSIFGKNATKMSPDELIKIQKAFVKSVIDSTNIEDAKRIVILAFMMLGWDEEDAERVFIRITKGWIQYGIK